MKLFYENEKFYFLPKLKAACAKANLLGQAQGQTSSAPRAPGSKLSSLEDHPQHPRARKRSQEGSTLVQQPPQQWFPVRLRIPLTSYHLTAKNLFHIFLFFTEVWTDITNIKKNDLTLHFIKFNKNFSLMFSKDYRSIELLINHLLGSQKEWVNYTICSLLS